MIKYKRNIPLFLLVAVIVIIIQYDILKPTLDSGLTPDDLGFIIWYKSLGLHPLSQFVQAWHEFGAYGTVPRFYSGIVANYTGINYFHIQMFSIVLKSIGTLAVFPLVIIIFKNRLLAFLTTILFAMSFTSAGQLETQVEPVEYIGLFAMCFFLIIYGKTIQNNALNWKRLLVTAFLFPITLLSSTTRLYPLLILLPLIELYFISKNLSLQQLKISLIRILVLYSPLLLLIMYSPGSALGYLGSGIPVPLVRVMEGNWHLLLIPLQGLGHILAFETFTDQVFGTISLDSFGSYLAFILNGSAGIFILASSFIASFSSKRPLRFFLSFISANFLLEILIYFIAIHRLIIPFTLRHNFDNPRMYSTLWGVYIISLSFAYYLEWRKQGRNNLLLVCWLGPIVSLIFITLTWLLADINLGFGGAQDHYLFIPALGVNLLLASCLVLIFSRLSSYKLLKIGYIILVTFIMIYLYQLNKTMIYNYFTSVNNNGRGAAGQIMIQSKFKDKLKEVKFDYSNPGLFYFDTSEMIEGTFYSRSFFDSFPFWMHFNGDKLIDGCVEIIFSNEHSDLLKYIKQEDNQKGFIYKSFCVKDGKGGYRDMFYKPDNFYGFKIKDKDFIDIRKELLKELGF